MKVNELADMWIEYHHTNDESLYSAFTKVEYLVLDNAEKAWQMILVILKKDNSDTVISNLAAGPLEELLVQHGSKVIDRVEAKARQDSNFSKLIMGVWRNTMPEDIWSRVETLQSLHAQSV
ncbi:MAG: hypothetical protein ACI9FR_001016 [Cryomorphaceae bacterium]|jgi:hypothetical protein